MAEPPIATTPYVFISYASPDRGLALAIADALEAAGIRAWLDRRSLIGGMSWDAAIVRAIKDCTVFAVLCTPAGVASPNVMQELRLAWEEQRPTLPLRLAAVAFPDEMRYILAGRQWVEAVDLPLAAWLPDLCRALAGFGLVAGPPQPAPAVPAPEEPTPSSSLPLPLTSFVGRERELAAVRQLLATGRLVTLTGPGGTGKTRLAIEVARDLLPAYRDGACFVDLAPLSDPALVPGAMAQGLRVQEQAGWAPRELLRIALRDLRLLLILDNFEHLLAAAEFVQFLLQAGPAITVLITSRAPLRVPGEHEFPVPPLGVQEETDRPNELAHEPAVALFVARAQAVRADFALTAENAATVAAICRRLDGLPLAIELAAARMRVLPPAALLSRLTQALPVLTGGARTAPARQQTLRATIAWSYALLEPAEQTLLRRLAVFTGGCTLEAAEAVCGGDGDLGVDVLDGLSSLVEKSLLYEREAPGGEPRFRMLTTVQEFALGELAASGEEETVRRAHARYLVALGEEAEWGLSSTATIEWLARLNAERENIRSAVAWALARADAELALGLVGGLGIWFFFEAPSEGRQWTAAALALPGAAPRTVARARALVAAGLAAYEERNWARAEAHFRESVSILHERGDRRREGYALANLGRMMPHSYDAGRALLEQGAALLAECDDAWGRAFAAGYQGELARYSGLGLQARADYARAVTLFRQLGDENWASLVLYCSGAAAEEQGDYAGAMQGFVESLQIVRATRLKKNTAFILLGMGTVAEHAGKLVRAARLYGAAEKIARSAQASLVADAERAYAACLAATASAADDTALRSAWAAGQALSFDQAIAYALEEGGEA
jgi:predicted ATPase